MIKTDKRAVKSFVDRWQKAEGNEQREANSFWIELVEMLGIKQPTRFLDFERKVRGRRIDVFYEDMGILIENKSRGVVLDKAYERGRDEGGDRRMVTPYEQAKWYADNLPRSISPRWVVVCNFDEIRIHDLNLENPGSDYVSFTLEELPDQINLLSFFTDNRQSRLVKEKELSVKAGEIVGTLYKAFEGRYLNLDSDPREQRSLNVLIVRIVFLLYAEDAGLLQEHQAFGKYLKGIDASHMRQALMSLFQVLDTPVSERDPYLDADLAAFPYVNGGLFADEDIVIPQFTEQMKLDLILNASMQFDWKGISPTIFGAVFESTLNPETRHEGGMHYTSIENIHKVIDPLFLDDLKAELAAIEAIRVEKNRKLALRRYQAKLASVNILDPACGSGNFLTESYTALRKLENRVISDLSGDNDTIGMTFEDVENPIKVSISQFYGIEINDFAVSVAKTALWIAEQQMMEETQEILLQDFDFLPLKSNSNICEGNALRMDWKSVLSADKCTYICGNPPFLGHQRRSASQQEDMALVFGNLRGAGKLDYVCAWYLKTALYCGKARVPAAFVSTSSICQGESVCVIWKRLACFGYGIDFAVTPFVWSSEAAERAGVHVVVIGFSLNSDKPKYVYDGNTLERRRFGHINGYLFDAPDVFIESRGHPLNPHAPEMTKGSQPTDGGKLILDVAEADELVSRHTELAPFVRPYIGGREFLNGGDRRCLWFAGHDESEFPQEEIRERFAKIRKSRLASPTKSVHDMAAQPHLFTQIRQPASAYLAVPEVSSGRRRYIPIGYLPAEVIASNKLRFIPTDSMYLFGLLSSRMHAAWLRVVGGRLRGDYSYSPSVYNSFVWPNADDGQVKLIESCAQTVLDARSAHSVESLADLYDPDKMPDDLLSAHKALDAAVEAAYGVDFGGDEEKIVAHLFKLYAEKTAAE